MESNTLHRGRLIDHILLVVEDFEASKNFYTAVLSALEIPVITTANEYLLADELVITARLANDTIILVTMPLLCWIRRGIILRRCTMARLSAAPGLLRSASRSKRAKVTFSYLRNSHNKCGCYHFLNE